MSTIPVKDGSSTYCKDCGTVKNATLRVYPGFPHSMPIVHADVINQDLLEFIQG